LPAKFEYIRGGAMTEIPWFPPDPLLLNEWKEGAIDLIENSPYDFWICGGALEEWTSWDVDIVLTGELQDSAELKDLLDRTTQLGLNHRQLIDSYWCDDYRKPLEFGPCKRQQVPCDTYMETGSCTLEECMRQKSIEVILATSSIIKNGRQTWSVPESCDIGHSLFKYKARSPSRKQIKRIRSGTIYKSTPSRITRNLDFRDIIPWSHT
jgi:hypothetical protein